MPASNRPVLFLAFVALAAAIAVWLSCGVYADREFGEWHFFAKPRWSWRFYFHAPLGESDREERALGAADRQAEQDYREFVEGRNGAAGTEE